MLIADVLLNDMEGARTFVEVCDQVDCLIELVQGPFLIDAHSIIGVLTLDLSAPIRMEAHCDTSEQRVYLETHLARFAVTPAL